MIDRRCRAVAVGRATLAELLTVVVHADRSWPWAVRNELLDGGYRDPDGAVDPYDLKAAISDELVRLGSPDTEAVCRFGDSHQQDWVGLDRFFFHVDLSAQRRCSGGDLFGIFVQAGAGDLS